VGTGLDEDIPTRGGMMAILEATKLQISHRLALVLIGQCRGLRRRHCEEQCRLHNECRGLLTEAALLNLEIADHNRATLRFWRE